MSSSTLLARPSLATLAFGVATVTWSGLLVANGMMLAAEGRFVGNPLYTLAVGVAITSTVVGIQLRCHSFQATAPSAPRRPITATDITREIPRPQVLCDEWQQSGPRPTVRAVAHIDHEGRELARRLNRLLRSVDDRAADDL